jgi:hypothetical protein
VPRAAEAGPRHSRHLTAQRNGRERPFAQPSDVPRAHFWLSAQSTCAECLPKALGKELNKNQIHTFKPFLHQPTPLQASLYLIDIYFVFNNFISF